MIGLKRFSIMFLMVFCLLIWSSLSGNKWNADAQSKTWFVGTAGEERPVDFRSIRDAIDNASSGDTIFVYKGVYDENITLNKLGIDLVGEDRDLTIISSDNVDAVISIRADRVTVTGFTIRKSGIGASGYGIYVLSAYNVIKGNAILGVQDGILVYSYGNNLFSDNIIHNNTNSGVSLYLSIGNLISGNMFFNNYMGVSVSFSGSNTFSGNTFTNNSLAVFVSPSPNSDANTFYHNNFEKNGFQVATAGSRSNWDFGGEGNYWSDYAGVDKGGDGIGDSVHKIDYVLNQDNRPLMGMFSSFEGESGTETFVINIISNSTVANRRFEIGPETGNQIILFDVSGLPDTTGFARVAVPVGLLNYSLVLVGAEEIFPKVLGVSNQAYTYLYFTYKQSKQTVAIISSKTVGMYNELLDQYNNLRTELDDLNAKYSELLINYTTFLEKYAELQQHYANLNSSYNMHLDDFRQNLENTRNLMYIFAAATGVLAVATIYLSKSVSTRAARKNE